MNTQLKDEITPFMANGNDELFKNKLLTSLGGKNVMLAIATHRNFQKDWIYKSLFMLGIIPKYDWHRWPVHTVQGKYGGYLKEDVICTISEMYKLDSYDDSLYKRIIENPFFQYELYEDCIKKNKRPNWLYVMNGGELTVVDLGKQQNGELIIDDSFSHARVFVEIQYTDLHTAKYEAGNYNDQLDATISNYTSDLYMWEKYHSSNEISKKVIIKTDTLTFTLCAGAGTTQLEITFN